MRSRIGGLLALVLGTGMIGLATAQPTTAVKPPKWQYAHDLRVRNAGVKNFDKETPKVGVEFFLDQQNGAAIAISQTGDLTVAAEVKPGDNKKADWLFAHDLRARKAAEAKFTQTTAKFGVEVFQDNGTGDLLYVSDKAGVALAPKPANIKTEQDPAWHHALVLKVRGPEEKSFTKDSKQFGLEAFTDGNTGELIYISEVGSLAVGKAPSSKPESGKAKAPTALHGLVLQVRKEGEANFTDKTKKVPVEVFRDNNTNGLVYVSETGSIATAPLPEKVESGKGVTWQYGLKLKARPGGEEKWENAKAYGVEVFKDNNTGYLVYISETGSIAVLAK